MNSGMKKGNMMKKTVVRCLVGAPIGLTVSTIIAIVISLALGDGRFYAVSPELIGDCGTELNAVLLQTLLSLLYGAAWAGASAIWEIEDWSLLRQTVTHLVVCSAMTFPVAYFLKWMDHSIAGVMLYFGLFFGIYLAIWCLQYHAIKKRIRQMNEKVREKNGNE